MTVDCEARVRGPAPGRVLLLLGVTTCWLLSAGMARALTDEEIFRVFELDAVNPGARALGMGGASISIASDSTATLANPAGLYGVSSLVIDLDLRHTDPDTRTSGAQLGSLDVDSGTGDRDLPYLDLDNVTNDDSATDVSYLGEAFRLSKRFTFGLAARAVVSQDRTLSDGAATTGARFAFESFPNAVVGGELQAYSVDTRVTGSSSTDLRQLSAALTFDASPEFSIGATLTYAKLELDMFTRTRVDDPLQLLSDPGHPRLPTEPATDLYETRIDDSDTDYSYTIGIHWHPDNLFASGRSPLHVGAIYHKGASYELLETASLNDVDDPSFTNLVVEPDRFGVGASYRPDPNWTLTLDYERVEYSDMLEDYRAQVNYLTSDRVADGAFATDPERSVEYTVDDGSVLRLGGEYADDSAGGMHWAVRGGWYRLPDGQIRMSQFNSADDAINDTYRAAFRGEDEEDRFTVGAGLRFGRFSVELAGDFGDTGTVAVASLGFRFGAKSGDDAEQP
ncbi:MAG: hypothetical protein GY716_12125 [bacterium]|nr:hypothetical protein [bacterium]